MLDVETQCVDFRNQCFRIGVIWRSGCPFNGAIVVVSLLVIVFNRRILIDECNKLQTAFIGEQNLLVLRQPVGVMTMRV